MRPVTRITPQLPPQAMKTYQVARPLPTHWRPASCAEVDCPAHLHGWQTTIDVTTELGGRQANYIRLHSGRAYTTAETGQLVTFTFPPGQTCFAPHRLPLERDPLFAVREGDWRGNPRGTAPVRFRDVDQFLGDFGEHQQRLADRMSKG